MAEVMKRLRQIENALPFGIAEEALPDLTWLLKLTRALLESQGELMERVGNEECDCETGKGGVWVCPRCNVLARAEKVRKGEV